MTIIAARPAKCAFAVDKNGTNQTGVASITWTQVTFGTERLDIGAAFASSAWTPPAGKIFTAARVHLTGTIAAYTNGQISIYKNGSAFKTMQRTATGTNNVYLYVVMDDVANGTDAYTVYIYCTITGTGTIQGSTVETNWYGYLFAL